GQDEALARAAKAGDRAARNALFLRHVELVKQLGGHARRRLRMACWAGHANARLDPEDIDQQAFLAFCEVLAAWQPERGEPFLALLSRKLPWLLRTYLHGMLTGKRSDPEPQKTPFDSVYEKPGEHTPSDASLEAESSI